MTGKESPFTNCGRDFDYECNRIRITQQKMCGSLEFIDVPQERKADCEALVAESERSAYSTLLGQLLWIAQLTRRDVACAVS